MDTLRFIICGDDGQSGLIGCLLRESRQACEDGRRGQDIAINEGNGRFSTEKRKFIGAAMPESALCMRGMVSVASAADLAILLVDARMGMLAETKRYARIVAMLGLRHVVVAVHQMDAISWDEAEFNAIVADFHELVADLGFVSVQPVPISALNYENVVFRGEQADWYKGPALLEHLETVDVLNVEESRPFRMAVQYVDRTNPEFPVCCGDVASGNVVAGTPIRVVPGGVEARVASIAAWQGGQEAAGAAVAITLDRKVDVSRGQVLCSVDEPIEISDQFEASVMCLSEQRLVAGRPYLLTLHAAQVGVTITDIKFKLDIDHGSHLAANTLELNDIGEVTLYTTRPVAFESYKQCRPLGAFTLIDQMTNETVGAGMVNFALRRASNIHWQAVDVNKAARAALKSQEPACIWFTGLSGSGKSTVANLLEKRLHAEGRHTYLLDGDNVRHGLCRDLGFTEADRVENIRRVAEAAKLMVDAGLIVIASFISPFRAEREFARSLFEPGEFYEVFVDAPIEECEKRDAKGLYAKARQGKIVNFTGIDSLYESPKSPEVRLDTVMQSPDDCVELVTSALKKIP